MQGENVPSKKRSSVQTGIDRYINVKRKLSPIKTAANTKKFQAGTSNSKKPEILNGKRFALLSKEPNDEAKGTTTVVNAKPPPIYLRERSSNALVSKMSNIIGTNNFHIVPLKTGNIDETKIQAYSEKSFMDVVKFLSNNNKNYYSYQLKSTEGLVVVIKDIESSVDSNDVKEELEECGFSIKSVINIFHRNKVPQPIITVEELHKGNGPVQFNKSPMTTSHDLSSNNSPENSPQNISNQQVSNNSASSFTPVSQSFTHTQLNLESTLANIITQSNSYQYNAGSPAFSTETTDTSAINLCLTQNNLDDKANNDALIMSVDDSH
ncbi:uncharacterized protein LOC120780377 [Bactrocera tryoni]|uniref:uncharacterized protein LOC120780377 n=1 Tax=Bactrocera tryoni TaxID=59916 RepID=UPI001A96801F|nr:uncharacterized protein LOC120780377 [Bactrocera tryoni]